MPVPSWPLLLWSGLAATCAAALFGSAIGGRAHAPWALAGWNAPTGGAAGMTLLAGLLLYPALYGVALELVGQSSAAVGLALGAVHGLAALAVAAARGQARHALRHALMHVVYGATLAFLYVTP